MSFDKRVPLKRGKVWTPDGSTPTPETKPNGQYLNYWVLSDEERAKGFVRPVRDSYVHVGTGPVMDGCVLIKPGQGGCGTLTTMSAAIAETYARDPKFYGATFCCGCGKHLPVGEFMWPGTCEVVGS